jgi:hypothetical protein
MMFLLALVVSSALSVVLVFLNPPLFEQALLPIFYGIVVVILIGWHPKLGGCALTAYEKRLRRAEGLPEYETPFIAHYLHEWFGIVPPKGVITGILLALMVLPIIVFILGRLI